MSNVFFTGAWGAVSEAKLPIVTFSKEKYANNFISQYRSGDWLAIVGTLSEPTSPENRGRFLSMVQVASGSEVIDAGLIAKRYRNLVAKHDWDSNGNYLWPYGFVVLNAVRFVEVPRFGDVLDLKRSGFKEALQAIKLSKEDAEKVLSLATEPVDLKELDIVDRLRGAEDRKQSVLGLKSAEGLANATTRSGSELDATTEHYVYIMELLTMRDACKVGMTNNLDRRLSEVNQYRVLDDDKFKVHSAQPVDNRANAARLEEMLKRRLNAAKKHIKGEFYSLSPEKVHVELGGAMMDFIQKSTDD